MRAVNEREGAPPRRVPFAHHQLSRGGELRVDCTVTYSDDNTKEAIVMAHPHEDYDHDLWFQAYTPKEDDGCFIEVFFLSLDPFLPYVRAHSSHISPLNSFFSDGLGDRRRGGWW